jgi:hypothetical protein
MSVRLDHFPHEEHHVDGGGLVRVPKKVHERGDNGGGRIWKFDRRGMDGRDEHSTILGVLLALLALRLLHLLSQHLHHLRAVLRHDEIQADVKRLLSNVKVRRGCGWLHNA